MSFQNRPIVIDIETAPCLVDEYKALFPQSKKKGGLHAIISQVVAIGISDDGQKSVLGVDEFGSEKSMLDWCKGIFVGQNGPVVGFNIKNFDMPFLQMRAAKYGIGLNLPDRRSGKIVDIYESIGGKWQTDVSACSLSELAYHLYGEAKTSNGADVAAQFAAGDMEAIKEHCLQDVILTEKIYHDFKGIMW